MDGARDAVVKLGIQLGQLVAGVDAGLRDVPDSRCLHDIPDHKLADRLRRRMLGVRKPKLSNPNLILRDGLGAVCAAHILDVAPAVLVPAMVPPLRGHLLEIGLIEAELMFQFLLLREVDLRPVSITFSEHCLHSISSLKVGKEIIICV